MPRKLSHLYLAAKRSMIGMTFRDKGILFICNIIIITSVTRKKRRQLLQNFFDKLIGGENEPVACRCHNKICRFYLRKGSAADMITAAEFTKGMYPSHKTEKPIEMIVDCGANIGLFSIYANKLYPDAKITCYEPDESNYKILLRNLSINNIKATVHKMGCWKKDGTVYFRPSVSNAGKIFPHPPGIPIKTVKPHVSNNAWLKMDIEGSEFETIPAVIGDNTLPRVISMEIHRPFGDVDRLIEFLKEKGYDFNNVIVPNTSCFEITVQTENYRSKGNLIKAG